MNCNFGHLNHPDNRLIYAADTAKVGGIVYSNPSATMYARCVPPELPIVNNQPPDDPPSGYHYEFRSYEVADGSIRRVYELVQDPPPPPKAYDRYKVVTALKAEGVWRDVRAAMLAEDEDALDMLYTADDISEDEPLLLAMIAMLKDEPYNWTDEKVAQVLAQAEIGGVR